MQNMSDEELDKLFKNAAEGVQVPHDPSAWQEMATRLDKHTKAPTGFRTKPALIVASVLTGLTLVSVVLLVSTEKNTPSVKKNYVAGNEASASKSITPDEAEEKPNRESSDATSIPDSLAAQRETFNPEGVEQSGVSKIDDTAGSFITSSKSERLRLSGESRSKASSNATQKQNLQDVERDPDFQEALTLVDSSGLSGKVTRTENKLSMEGALMQSGKPEEQRKELGGEKDEKSQSHKKESANEVSVAERKPLLTEELQMNADSIVLNTQNSLTDSAAIAVAGEPGTKKKHAVASLSVKVVASPDFSSVDYFTPDRSGWNYGVLLGYNVNNRWSVYTGLVVSRKVYSSTNITKPYSTGTNDYPVKRLDGDCRVLDIPVNVYYRFLPRKSFSLTAGLGLSSYLMNAEDYVYVLDKAYGDNTYTQSIDNKNKEWFKVLNLSVMVEKQIGKRMFIEFEPFVKAPLAGVGEGEVSLVSMGAFFNLRYTIPLKI
jgi:hypothetical protein